MRLQYIELVVALAEHGSLSAAAVHLNKSQPAMSKALRQLEADLGTAIFLRTPPRRDANRYRRGRHTTMFLASR